jgi:hypothetical protein
LADNQNAIDYFNKFIEQHGLFAEVAVPRRRRDH